MRADVFDTLSSRDMTRNGALASRRILIVEDELVIALDLCSKLKDWMHTRR